MCISNKSINLVDSLINGRAISFSAVSTISSHFNFNFTQAYVNALKFSAALNSTLLDANSGPLAIKCTDDVFSPHKPDQYPIQNFLSATCTVETSRQIALNVMPKPLDLVSLNLKYYQFNFVSCKKFYFPPKLGFDWFRSHHSERVRALV